MMANIWWSLPLTLVVFFAARKLAVRFKMPLLNPLLVAMVVIIPFLLLTGIPYERYFAGSKILNDLLQPAVVALAFPLYEQLHQIRARWKSIITICFVGSLVAMITGTSVALLMGASPQIAASILPKSVTTPIAMAVGGSIGGIPAISAVCVIFVGILGAVFGHTLLNIMKIRTKAARGLAMGTASHALGTARCAELDYQEGAFSSLALVICGIITSWSRRLSSRLFWQSWAKICDASRKFHFHFISCTHNEIWITYKGRTAPYTTDPLTLMRQRHASTFSSRFLSACREFAISPGSGSGGCAFPRPADGRSGHDP